MFLVSLVAALAAATGAQAHRTSLATAQVAVDGSGTVWHLTLSAHDLAVVLGIPTDLVSPIPEGSFRAQAQAISGYLDDRLAIQANGRDCPLTGVAPDYGGLPDTIALEARYACPKGFDELALDYRLFFDIDPRHRAALRLTFVDGSEQEMLLEQGLARVTVSVAARQTVPWTERFMAYFVLGVEHILIGYDHILFLLALLIVAHRLSTLLAVVTAFTVAHSVTLALAWFGVVDLPGRLVESAIALSIAYVALENILRGRPAGRWILAGGFGLVHGLGFASVLQDLGPDRSDPITPLLAFNLGVEAGQILIVLLTYGPLVLWARQPWYRRTAQTASLAILAVACFWFAERSGLV